MRQKRTVLMLLLTLSASLYLLLLGLQNSMHQLTNEANQQSQQITQTLRQSVMALEGVAQIANQFYLQQWQSPLPLLHELELDKSQLSYTQDLPPLTPRGNLTGEGDYRQDASLRRELTMAMMLNPYLAKVAADMPEVREIYYTSVRHFSNRYPWRPSALARFHPSQLQHLAFLQGLPKYNPQRLTYWSPVYEAANSQEKIVTLSAPIYEQNRFRGVLSLDIAIRALHSMLIRQQPAHSEVLLLDQGNQIVATTLSPSPMLSPPSDLQSLLPASLHNPGKRLQDLQAREPHLIGGYYLYRAPVQGTQWQLYYLLPLHMALWSALQLATPVLLVGLLLMVALRENQRRKRSEEQLQAMVLQLQVSRRTLEQESKTDPLTHLYNRRGMLELLTREMTRSKRYNRPCSLIMCDIDFFKKINDHYGHDGGDQCLITLSQLLQQQLRTQDAMSRWGGEEFLIMLPETNQQQAMVVADKLRQSVAQMPFHYRNQRIALSITAGVAEFDTRSGLEASIERADRALYQGKQNGRNRCIAAMQLVSEWE